MKQIVKSAIQFRKPHRQFRAISQTLSRYQEEQKPNPEDVQKAMEGFKRVEQKPLDDIDDAELDEILDDVIEDDEEIILEEKPVEVEDEDDIEEVVEPLGQTEKIEFQAETKQLMDIVATALYTDKDVFIRELISNASDALEKMRQLSLSSEEDVDDRNAPLDIKISVDEKAKTFTIQDNGIGMNKEELIECIGTIAKSGSKDFIKQLKDSGSDETANIIGQFGVGFYSAFMVAKNVKLYTRSYKKGSQGYQFFSTGGGTFNLTEVGGVPRGTKIVIQLKDTEKEFSMKETVERVIKKYSNFVQYDINLNQSKVDTLEAIWLRNKKDITPSEHKQFFQYLSKGGGEPMYTLQFHTDIPLSIYSLFYIPSEHNENMGNSQAAPDVNVYSKKVLIKPKHREILPDWLRFVKGAVDSEDLPLNISREHLQNSPLIRRINGILTKKILGFFRGEMNFEREKYNKFHSQFHVYFKEGILQDFLYKEELSKLLVFESTHTEGSETVSFDEYIKRMKDDQNDIYYVTAPSKKLAMQSPYYEPLKHRDYEVLILKDARDEATINTIMTYNNKKLVCIDSAQLEIQKDGIGLNKDQVKEISEFVVQNVEKCQAVETTNRLHGTAAVIKDPESSVLRHYRRIAEGKANQPLEVAPQTLLVDPKHEVLLKLYGAVKKDMPIAKTLAKIVFDNALVAAGLIDDARYLLPNLQEMTQLATRTIPMPNLDEHEEKPVSILDQMKQEAEEEMKKIEEEEKKEEKK